MASLKVKGQSVVAEPQFEFDYLPAPDGSITVRVERKDETLENSTKTKVNSLFTIYKDGRIIAHQLGENFKSHFKTDETGKIILSA